MNGALQMPIFDPADPVDGVPVGQVGAVPVVAAGVHVKNELVTVALSPPGSVLMLE